MEELLVNTIENIVAKGEFLIMRKFSFCQSVFKSRRINIYSVTIEATFLVFRKKLNMSIYVPFPTKILFLAPLQQRTFENVVNMY